MFQHKKRKDKEYKQVVTAVTTPIPESKRDPWIVLNFSTPESGYTSYKYTIPFNAATFYYAYPEMKLKKITALLSRQSSSSQPGYIIFRRLDTGDDLAKIVVTKDNLHVVEITTFTNLPIQSTIIDIIVYVSKEEVDLRIHSISFHV